MRANIDSFIKCPFFQQLEKNLLCCEGFVDNTCMTTKFVDRNATLQYIADNCTKVDGGRCPMAMNLFSKYRAIEEAQEKAEQAWRETVARVNGFRLSPSTGKNA